MIMARGLSFGYDRGDPVVADLDVDFASGTISALVGPSGSGKSTLLYLIGLMLSATGGSLVIDGVETVGLADWERAELRAASMGFVFQDALLDPARSILDNVLESSLYSPPRLGLADRATALLDEFGVTVDPERRPGQISGGQAQRVALCRAFLTDPPIILADEPTGNLDADSANTVWQALHARAADGATVLVATHDRARARKTDSILEVGHAPAR